MTDVVQFARCLNMTIDLSRVLAISEPVIRNLNSYEHEIVLLVKMQGDTALWEITRPVQPEHLVEGPDPEDEDHWYGLLRMSEDHEYPADRADKSQHWGKSLVMIDYRKQLSEFIEAWNEVRKVSVSLSRS